MGLEGLFVVKLVDTCLVEFDVVCDRMELMWRFGRFLDLRRAWLESRSMTFPASLGRDFNTSSFHDEVQKQNRRHLNETIAHVGSVETLCSRINN